MISHAGKGSVAVALLFAAMLGYQGLQAYKKLVEKAQAQEAVMESVQRWKESFRALAGSVQRWERSYRREDSVHDLVTLYSVINLANYGLSADIDTVGLQKVSSVEEGGVSLGLTKICIASSSAGDAGTLEVKAPNYQVLFSGLQSLAERPDLYIGTIAVLGDRPVPVARLGEFCVLLRKN